MFLKILMLNVITTSITQSRKCSGFVRINIQDGQNGTLFYLIDYLTTSQIFLILFDISVGKTFLS